MIELLIGNIASGKSTYANKRAQEGWVVVNDDAIITMLFGDYARYKRSYERVIKNAMLNLAAVLVDSCFSVVVDSSWLVSRAFRLEWYKQITDIEMYDVAFSREAPEIHAKRRFEHDPRGGTYEMWLEVAKRIDSLY